MMSVGLVPSGGFRVLPDPAPSPTSGGGAGDPGSSRACGHIALTSDSVDTRSSPRGMS